jgi:hypothetical protein
LDLKGADSGVKHEVQKPSNSDCLKLSSIDANSYFEDNTDASAIFVAAFGLFQMKCPKFYNDQFQ